MINNVVVTGRLTRAVDLRYTSNGTAFASFTLAVDRPFRNQNNEKETDFINCVMWRKSAENLANYTNKGSLIGVEGRIQTRNYDNGQGQRVYVTEVLAERFTFLESAKTANNDVLNDGGTNRLGVNNNQNSMGNFGNSDPFTSNGDVFSVNDDDLPF
ncbi:MULTISPECIES: single-stranded DNA-binding protein [unclassified Granulicatella]|uniref:single-stranded DNA-binding protein n=1 Tax=unclassified Granulicatella TaxID=2630493 RepID=UPI00066CF237|nr:MULTISPECIES: single-stranded DNA-binding protein [unclassified Granulicatella]